MNDKVLFLLTLVTAVLFSGAALAVVAAPAVSAAGSLISAWGDIGASTVDTELDAELDDTSLPPAEEYPRAPGAGLTVEDVETS